MNTVKRQKMFNMAVRHDDHFKMEEDGAFVKIMYKAPKGWEVWSVVRRSDFDKVLEDALQAEKASFLNTLINNDLKDVR